MSAQPHVQSATAEPLLDRLQGVVRQGGGWRARCPAHKGQGRTLAVKEVEDRVVFHCFAGCKPTEVLEAVGLTWASVQPPKFQPQTREERRAAARAMREVGLLSAMEVLMREAYIIQSAARHVARWECLSAEDDARLAVAVERTSGALIAMRDFDYWQRRNPA